MVITNYKISVSHISPSEDGSGTVISGIYQEKEGCHIKYPYSIYLETIKFDDIKAIGKLLIKTLLLGSISHYSKPTLLAKQNYQYIEEFPVNLEKFIQEQQAILQVQINHLFLLKLLYHSHGLQLFRSEVYLIDQQQTVIIKLDRDFAKTWYDDFLYKYGLTRNQFTNFMYNNNKIQSIYYSQLNSEEVSIFNEIKNKYQYDIEETAQFFASVIKSVLFTKAREEIGFSIIKMAIDEIPVQFIIQPNIPQISQPIVNKCHDEADDWYDIVQDLQQYVWMQNKERQKNYVFVNHFSKLILLNDLSCELADMEPIYTDVLQAIGNYQYLAIPFARAIANVHGVIYNSSEIYYYIKKTGQALPKNILTINVHAKEINDSGYETQITICNSTELNKKIIILGELGESEDSLFQGNKHIIYDLDQVN